VGALWVLSGLVSFGAEERGIENRAQQRLFRKISSRALSFECTPPTSIQQTPNAGGMTLSESSLQAAAWGAAFGLPLVLCSWAGHTKAAKREFPVLDELHTAQRQLVAPLVAGEGGVVAPCWFRRRLAECWSRLT